MSEIKRREFLKLVGVGGVGAGAGFMINEAIKHPVEHLIPYSIPPEEYSAGIATWYNTVCGMCDAGCGISVRTREGRAKKIEGNPNHPVSQGKLCALGQAGLQSLYNPDRITSPLTLDGARGSAAFVPTSWDEGIARLAERLVALRRSGQGRKVAFLTQGVRGHLAQLFELFMTQINGGRLLHYDFAFPHALYAANKNVFGEDDLPYYDIKDSHYVVSFGADYLGSWISPVHHSLGFGHSRQGRDDERGHFVQIEQRMSLSGAAADEWIAANPGSEGILALGMARKIVSDGHYQGADRNDLAAALARYTPAAVEKQTGVSQATIAKLADDFYHGQPSLAIGGGAAAGHTNGVDALSAVNLLNYLVGNIGKAGGLVLNEPPTAGQGSRQRQASYTQMTDLAAAARRGEIDVLIVNNTNPVFSLPAEAGFKEALAKVPLVVSLSSFMDETTALADLVLPSHTYLESWGDDFPEPGVGFAVGSIVQPVVSPLYDTAATGDTVLRVAREMGLGDALPWPTMQDYLQHGWSTIHARAASTQSFEEFWRALLQAGVWGETTRRDHSGFALDKSAIDALGVAAPTFAGDSGAYPLVLQPYVSNTMHDGRGANLPWMQELPDPMTSVVYGSWVEVNPKTAKSLGVRDGDLVEVSSPQGKIVAPVLIYPAIMPNVIAMPIGQGHSDYGRYAKNRGTNPLHILAPQTDAKSGALAWAATRVKLVATGKKANIVRTGGESRELGRNIIQKTGGGSAGGHHGASLGNIPIKVEST